MFLVLIGETGSIFKLLYVVGIDSSFISTVFFIIHILIISASPFGYHDASCLCSSHDVDQNSGSSEHFGS